ncbi:flavoprotein-domain-containing protein [Chaetomium tenue]|uniref:Flavoprotein-domain-containing protein n=1 Tax=Chaetomium tenue TaxID=1854479 RepID=A0ACB7PLR1_9PEZI|nr:flavoprotein-domain-containing protein [Chaetomium globosum]
MLQSVGTEHDDHYESGHSNSIEALVAARDDGKKHLLLAASVPVIVEALAKYQDTLSIRIVLTESATHFLSGQSDEQPTVDSLLHLPNVDAVYRDHHEWGPRPWRRGASILHIELRRWADMLVVAPLSANTLAKVVHGMSDNLLTSVIRAWDTDSSIDMKKKIILVAPAMNSAMWRNPVTNKQIRVLTDDWGVKEEVTDPTSETRSIVGWFKVITPISKTLACGDTGGAMASVESICEAIERDLNLAVEN